MSESTSSLAGRIFISYRREETGYAAGWLYDRLAARFGGGQVFKDVDSIQLGDDFVDVITSAVGSCDVLLALIGDRWSTVTDEDGKHRLDDPDDFVRLEIEAALTRDVRVIPILVDGARMPAATELPASLGTLVRRQSLDLDPTSFEFDTNRLLKVLDSTLAEVQTARRTTVADVEPAPGTTPMTTTPAEAGPGSGSAEPSQDPALTGEPAPSVPVPPGEESASTSTAQRSPASGRSRWLIAAGAGALVILIIVVVVLATRSDDPTPSSASSGGGQGIEVDATPVTSDDQLELTDLTVESRNDPPRVNDTVTVSYSLTNVGEQPIELEYTFVGARNPADDNKDAEDMNEGKTLEPGETISANGRVLIESAGRWDVWPCYQLTNGNGCPDEWQAVSFLATS
jgi:hypothetical protein